MRTRGNTKTDPRYAHPKARKPSPSAVKDKPTQRSAVKQTDRIFDYYVQGFTTPQIANATGLTRPAVVTVIQAPAFRERVEQFRTARREAVAHRLESASETAAVALLVIARGGERDEKTGQMVPIDPRVAEMRIKASDSILDRGGFPKATRGLLTTTSSTVVTGAVRTGDGVSDEDMERLRALLGLQEQER